MLPLDRGARMPAPRCPTPKIRVLIVTLSCLPIKTNISIFWVRPWIHSFRQISTLCWRNCYSLCWPLLPWASLKHGQRYPRLFKDWRKATWPCIIWLRQLCSGLSHLNYNHRKRCTRLHGHRAKGRNMKPSSLTCPGLLSKGNSLFSRVSGTTEETASHHPPPTVSPKGLSL